MKSTPISPQSPRGSEGQSRVGKCVADARRAKRGKDAGSAHSSAMGATEDAAPRSSVDGARLVRAIKRAAVGCVLAALGLSLAAAPASAGLYHPKPAACSFGADGTSATSFPGFGHQVAFQRQSRRLYVAASASGSPADRLYGFDGASACPAGEAGGYPPLAGFEPLLTPELAPEAAIAVDDSAAPSQGRTYLATGNAHKGLLCYQPGGEGCPGFPVAEPAGEAWAAVAVDPGGDVGAATSFPGDLRVQPGRRGTRPHRPLQLARPRRVRNPRARLRRLRPPLCGQRQRRLAPHPPRPRSAASNRRRRGRSAGGRPRHGRPHVAHSKRIARYDEAGEAVESFPAAAPGGAFSGVAVDEASEAVYAVDRNGANKAFVFRAFTLPDLATAPLSGLGETSATLNGSVHPDGVALTGCRFEWVGEAAYLESGFEDLSSGGEHECEPAFGSISTSGTTAVAPRSPASLPEGRYRFRLSAANANGENHSKPVAFQLAKPGAETLASPIRTATSARLDSRVDPHGIATEYSFQYLTEAQYEADGEASARGPKRPNPARPARAG